MMLYPCYKHGNDTNTSDESTVKFHRLTIITCQQFGAFEKSFNKTHFILYS